MEMTIYEKLSKIQRELHAPKNQRNNFGNYKYRSCEDICEALKPLLEKEKLSVTLQDSIFFCEGRFYIQATATLHDSEGASVSTTAFAREEESKKGMDGSQVTGAASSYARKYALNGLFLIDDNKDADATNTHGKEAPKEEKKEAPKEAPKAPKEDEYPFVYAPDGYMYCENCKGLINAVQGRNGQKIFPKEVARIAFKATGHQLCAECTRKFSGG